MSVQRYDSGRLSKAGVSPTGGARLSARLARTGVQAYRLPDGTIRREYRPAEEVFKADSLASYVGSILTIGHPKQGVTPKNYAKEAVGNVIAPTRVKADDGHEYVEALSDVNRDDAIEKVDAGEGAELSAGYRCDFDPTPGTVPQGEPGAGEAYDGVQRNIRVNHVAILAEGRARAGRGAKFLTDAADEPEIRLDSDGNQLIETAAHDSQEPAPMKIKFAGKEWDAGPELQVAISTFENESTASAVKLTEATTGKATADAKADAADKAKLAAEAKVTPDAIASLVSDEIAFRASVAPILDEVDPKTKAVTPFKFDGKSRKDVKTAVVKKLSAKDLKADENDVYVDAYFDSAIEQHKKDAAEAVKRGERSESYVPKKTPADSAVTKKDGDDLYLDEAAWAEHLRSFHGKAL